MRQWLENGKYRVNPGSPDVPLIEKEIAVMKGEPAMPGDINFMTLGIYIHIPFCVKKCPYCDFISFTPGTIPEKEYVSAVIKELETRKEEPSVKQVETIYFGGGTPSLLSPNGIDAILEGVSKNFRISTRQPVEGKNSHQDSLLPQGEKGRRIEYEVTIEANPGTVGLNKLRGYRDAGVNRLSIGIQSLNNKFLSTLGRIHTRREALNAYEAARRAGFENIGVDLIHSIPGESQSDWGKDLKEAISLRPEHISAYSLTIEEGTPFYPQQGDGLLAAPHEEAQAGMFLETKEILGKEGYEHYEISNYSIPGIRSRHNQIYWKGGEYIGFGVSAHSYCRGLSPDLSWGIRRANTSSLDEYFRLINEKGSAFVEEEFLTKEKAMGEALFLGFRMMEGVNLNEFKERFGVGIDTAYPDALRELTGKDLLETVEGHLRLTRKGLLFLNDVSARFV